MGHVEFLLEVVLKREIDERRSGSGEFHAGCQPALNEREIARRQMPIEVRHEGAHLDAIRRIKRLRVDPRTGHDDHAQLRYSGSRHRPALQDAANEMRADTGSADGDDADTLARAVTKRLPQIHSRAEGPRVFSQDISGEVEVFGYPVAHVRQIPAERSRDHVFRLADKDGAIAYTRVAFDMLDHLGIVITGQEGLALAARRHRQKADEIGEPGQRSFLQFRMFMPEMIDVPGFVSDDEIVVAVLDGVLENHEVRDQHFVHSSQRLEGVQIMFARFQYDVPGWAGEPGTERMDIFAVRFQQA